MKVLVVGGAGYVGATTAHALVDAGCEVHVLDDLSTGHRSHVPSRAVFHLGSAQSEAGRILADHRYDVVLHFAAQIAVGESVRRPLSYYQSNLGSALAVLEAMRATGTECLVVSSTAAVYAAGSAQPLTETSPLGPASPYGRSKLWIEQIIADCGPAWGLRAMRLRYFNAAGADPAGRCGESHAPETHLIPLVLQAVDGGRALTVFGSDYPTRDGTCERDYLHVADLADAHIRACRALMGGHAGAVLNLGTGRGATVREVLTAVERMTGGSVPHSTGPARAGDVARLVADPSAALRTLEWRAARTLDDIVRDAWRWHQQRRPRRGGEGEQGSVQG